ncbi:hypothetical protein M409DRAFT_49268 [Zasmidium cellare ATCC 36951]|uniref:DUF6604 domain-containing protein n=1 Tax=Zasmidium cellare ATCC 36951 TaxID=1080233 RepID=A0A6A6D031_ZASCE|nr:uncharacterized protein M409DRAFT_49268 [Zasmidium cellare ATCC 36951]KAF2172731.1 hypothetical protein M409DRAFT_49268 [Zasmidium cellare ATCC 36951]
MFTALNVEESTSDNSVLATSSKKPTEDQYEVEVSDADDFFAMMSFVKDMNDIRDHLRGVWSDYQCGKLDLMSAAITTDTAFNMMKRHSYELDEAYPGSRHYLKFVDFLVDYMDNRGGSTDEFEEWICSPTFEMLLLFAERLVPNKVPALELRQGSYDPQQDRTLMSRDQQKLEDLRMVFIDIHHVLWDDSTHPFEQMQATGKIVVDTLDSYFAFSRGRSVDVWTPEHDELLQHLRTFADAWTQKDNMAPLFRSEYEKMGVSRTPYLFLKRHPVLCGLLIYRMNTQLQEPIYPAHLYNAARHSASLESDWKDMDYIISLHSPQRIFVGAPPTEAIEYLKRFVLALGASATNFARNRRTGGRSLIVESKKGPRGLKTTTPVKDVFHDRYMLGETAKLSTANLIAMLSVAAKAERTSNPSTDLQSLARELVTQKQYSPLQLLDIVREGVAGEELHLNFDYFGLHQRSWKMLRTLQAHLHADLVKYFGETYMEEESQLPYVIGYLFEVVWGSDRIMEALRIEGGSRMLHTAAEILDRFLRDEENSAKSITAAKTSSNAVMTGASISA